MSDSKSISGNFCQQDLRFPMQSYFNEINDFVGHLWFYDGI